MNFLKAAIQAAHGPKLDIIKTLKKNLAKPLPPRSHKEIHASDLTKEFFCPRQVALLDITKKERKPEVFNTALRVTFDVGEITAETFREKWMVENTVGDWLCLRCGLQKLFCKQPPAIEPENCCHHIWKYREVRFFHNSLDYSGAIDCILDLEAPKLYVIELKIMSQDEFKKISGPLAEHRIRTSLYMHLIENSSHPNKGAINCKWGKVLYVSRGYGIKHESGELLPFKEFDVERNDAELETPHARALAVKLFREKGCMPQFSCQYSYSPEAKGCPVVLECFSGKYPPSFIPLQSEAEITNMSCTGEMDK